MKGIALVVGVALVGGCVLLLAGCTSTKLDSFSDPAFASRTYARIAVHGGIAGLAEQKELEQTLAKFLVSAGVEVKCCHELFLPTREYTGEESSAVFNREGCHGYLDVTLSRDAFSSDGTGRGSRYHAILYDVSTWKKVWVGDAEVTGFGNHSTDDKVFFSSLGKRITEDLRATGHIGNK